MPMHAKEKELLPPVFVNPSPSQCAKCATKIEPGALFTWDGQMQVCARCSDIAELAVLRSGLAELTRLASSLSERKFAILIWQDVFQRWVRTGLLLEKTAVERATKQLKDKLENATGAIIKAADAVILNPPASRKKAAAGEPLPDDLEADSAVAIPYPTPAQIFGR